MEKYLQCPFEGRAKGTDKLSGLWRSKSGTEDSGRDLSKRRFSMIFTREERQKQKSEKGGMKI